MMAGDAGATLWVVIDILFVAVLAVALVYAIMQWRKRPRDPVIKQVSDEAVRKEYHSEQ